MTISTMTTKSDFAQSILELQKITSIVDKVAIQNTYANLGQTVEVPLKAIFSDPHNMKTASVAIGDDTAAIPDKDSSYLLFASEGIIENFVKSDPWFAGYSAVMVNISDICAMGGLPIAVTDVIWSEDDKSTKEIWNGMLAASKAYNVPIVGGHTCYHSKNECLSVSILGRAKQLLTSFNAQEDDDIIIAIDHSGSYYKDYPFFNASTSSKPNRLQKIINLPYEIANKDWATSCKDISMGGIFGTLAMLLQTSGVGANIIAESISLPTTESDWVKWCSSFPSYGYLFTAPKKNTPKIRSLFEEHDISSAVIGSIKKDKNITIINQDQPHHFMSYA